MISLLAGSLGAAVAEAYVFSPNIAFGFALIGFLASLGYQRAKRRTLHLLISDDRYALWSRDPSAPLAAGPLEALPSLCAATSVSPSA